MKFPTLVQKVIEKTAPMSTLEANDLNNQCAVWYETKVEAVKKKQQNGEPLTLIDKIFQQADSWYVRLALTVGFYYIVRYIQDIMNPGDDPQDELDDPRAK